MQQVISTQKIHLAGRNSVLTGALLAGTITRFIEWCNMQEKNRFVWLAISVVGGIGTILPITLLAIVFGADNNFNLWATVCIINTPVLIVNLAVQPTKLILPVLFFAWIVDAIIIMYCLALFML